MLGKKVMKLTVSWGSNSSLVLLSFVAALVGVATSLIIAWFMVAIDQITSLLNQDNNQGFIGLTSYWHFGLPILGSLLLIAMYRATPGRMHDVGIAHVIDRLRRGRAHLPISNAIFQFFTAIISLGSGFSVGKEGPSVHIGSAIGSRIGRELHRAPSQLRLLTGCGCAAAISAAFSTPLAGVLFAMEVVLMEYSLAGFIPVIIAAVVAAVATEFLLGGHPAFLSITLPEGAIDQWGWLVLTGLICGVVAVLFHFLVKQFLNIKLVRLESRLLLAGIITGAIAFFVPHVMGLGYETIDAVITNELTWIFLLALLLAKVFASAAALGLGIPAGTVAPALVIGVTCGALVGQLVPGEDNDAIFALLGMAGMMSALLHAPLAALAAVLELSLLADIMFPAMIVVILANLVCQVVFQQPSIFKTMLAHRGLTITTHPVRNALASRFVSEISHTNFIELSQTTLPETKYAKPMGNKMVALIQTEAGTQILWAEEFNKLLEGWHSAENNDSISFYDYIKTNLPSGHQVVHVDEDISLLQAIEMFQQSQTSAILAPKYHSNNGLITRAQLTEILTKEGDLH